MEMMALPDEASLIERAKTDSEAFRQLYERYLPELYRYTYYRTGNPTVLKTWWQRRFCGSGET